MQPRIIILVLLLATSDLFACSYCRSKVPAAAQGAPAPSSASSGGGATVVRGVAAAKSAVNLNDNGFWAVKEEEKAVSERGTYDMVVSPSEIYGN